MLSNFHGYLTIQIVRHWGHRLGQDTEIELLAGDWRGRCDWREGSAGGLGFETGFAPVLPNTGLS
jgi:hypothetical protein